MRPGRDVLLRVPPAVPILWGDRRRLRAQRLPAFCAARVQDFAASFGCHARTEAVAVFANQVRRLECTFAHREPPCGCGRKITEIRGPTMIRTRVIDRRVRPVNGNGAAERPVFATICVRMHGQTAIFGSRRSVPGKKRAQLFTPDQPTVSAVSRRECFRHEGRNITFQGPTRNE